MPQNNITDDQKKRDEQDRNFKSEMLKIELARQEFAKKNFRRSLEIFRTVMPKDLLNELDNRLILFAEQHIRDEEK